MGLMDEFKNEQFGPPIKCSVHKVCVELGGEEGAELRQAVDEGLIPAMAIARVLARRGIRLTAEAMGRHRRKECGCAK